MTRSSPSRRSQQLPSPERRFLSSFLDENRNNELSHRDALAAAQVERTRVREAAIRVFQLNELQEEHQRIVEAEKREEERLRFERQIANEETRLQQLRAKSIPKPTPPPEPPREPTPPPPPQAPASRPSTEPKPVESLRTDTPPQAAPAPQSQGLFANQNKAPLGNPFSQIKPQNQSGSAPNSNPFSQNQPQSQPPQPTKPNGVVPPQPAVPAQPTAPTPKSQPGGSETRARLTQIYQELKKLRNGLKTHSSTPGNPLKGKLGDLRREMRVSIGQLTGVKGANTQAVNKVFGMLKNSLDGNIPSPPVDVSLFVVGERQPVEGALNNDAKMPSLFIYLVSVCAKAIINQFINEASANTKAADPIGVFTAQIFSYKELHWRGSSLIDILLAKFRIVCPVLFGSRGNDKMERGREALGWRREGPSWIDEQSHNNRMIGLGAGYASISLRDFGKSTKTNPYPPTHYWEALAGILNTPANETSNTQYVVLRSMISGHEQRFVNFYGNAAIAALRLAVVEFPKRAPQNAPAAGSLSAVGDLLRNEEGFSLG